MDLNNYYINTETAEKGTWIEIDPDGTKILIARAGGTKYMTFFRDLMTAEYIEKQRKGEDVSKEQELLERIKVVSVDVPHSMAHLAIRGKEVMKLRGMDKGGPLVGEILNHLLEVVTDEPELNTVEALSKIVTEFEE